MDRIFKAILVIAVSLAFSVNAEAQVDEICNEFGFMPSLAAPRLTAPFLYGRISVKTSAVDGKLPKISILYSASGQNPKRLTVGKSGNYCFEITGSGGGSLIIDVDGVEATRKSLPPLAPAQQREDFDIVVGGPGLSAAVISSKFHRPPNPKTAELYKQAAAATNSKDRTGALSALNQIVAIDPEDFIAWGLLGSNYREDKKLAEAEAAFRRSLAIRIDYTPAWISMGRIRTEQKQHEAAIEIFKHAAELEPGSAEIYQLLGESYLLTKQGSLGADALNQAIKLDPQGMAELHLQLAHLYQLAKADKMAADEYKKFLAKVPDHPDKKKFEKFIKEH
jgi:Tfp pilus assembly protein PilF